MRTERAILRVPVHGSTQSTDVDCNDQCVGIAHAVVGGGGAPACESEQLVPVIAVRFTPESSVYTWALPTEEEMWRRLPAGFCAARAKGWLATASYVLLRAPAETLVLVCAASLSVGTLSARAVATSGMCAGLALALTRGCGGCGCGCGGCAGSVTFAVLGLRGPRGAWCRGSVFAHSAATAASTAAAAQAATTAKPMPGKDSASAGMDGTASSCSWAARVRMEEWRPAVACRGLHSPVLPAPLVLSPGT